MRMLGCFVWLWALGVGPLQAQEQQDPPLRIVVVEGEGAINNIRDRTAKSPVVRVEDDDAQPIAGATVTFTLPAIGAGASFAATGSQSHTTPTDQRGLAIASGMRPNNVAGRFQIRVSASRGGQSATAVVNQINAAPALVRRSSRKYWIAALAAGGVVGTVLALRGGGSSSGGGTPGGTTITPGSPVFGPPR